MKKKFEIDLGRIINCNSVEVLLHCELVVKGHMLSNKNDELDSENGEPTALMITASVLTCLWVASRTLRILPLRGNTPYRSRPITPNPETARDLAESPSVRIRVHSDECFPP